MVLHGFIGLQLTFPADCKTIPEMPTCELKDRFIQGKNSNAGRFVNGKPQTGYIGPTPPDQTHDYEDLQYMH